MTTPWRLTEDQVVYEKIDSYFDKLNGDYAIFTVDPPWSRIRLRKKPKQVFMIHETDREILDGYISEVKGLEYVVGLGGGRAIDSAKYVAWKSGGKFVSIPTVIGADAYMTPVAAVRTEGIVSYLGPKFADAIVIDGELIRTAPPRLNRAGVGDIYSTKISLMDWRYSRDKDGDEYDPVVAKQAEDVLDLLSASTREIYDVTDKGIKSMVQMHIQLNSLQWPYISKGRTWPQEGIEHVFFYSLEKVSGKTYSHGEVLGTGCVLGAYIHGASVDEIIRELDSFGLQFRPKDYGLTFSDFEAAVSNMKEVTAAMHSYYPVLRDRFPKNSDISEVWRILN
jgi:glycerol-1-phosphate dehydrogenase [NAD(P)+]